MRSKPAITLQHICRVGIILAWGLVSGCGDSSDYGDTQASQSKELNSTRQSVCVVASGDTHGWIIPCGCTSNQSGGLLRRASFVTQRSESSLVIPVDVGGAADGTAPYQQERFKAILRGEQAMGLKAHNVGQAELAFGTSVLTELAAETGVTFVSANTTINGRHPFTTHMTYQQGGISIVAIGVVSPQFAVADVEVSEPANAILNVLGSLESRPDFVVVLAYLPLDELRQLAESLPEVDVIFGGPTGQALKPEVIGRTMLVSATNKGKFLATATFTGVGQPIVGDVVELSPIFSDDELQISNLKQFRKFLEERDFSASESGFVDAKAIPVDAKVAGSQSCRECHEETNNHWDTIAHSHAWQTLQHEGAHVDPACQQCHTTGYGLPEGFATMKSGAMRQNVGCESCHGPSAAHVANAEIRTPFDATGSCRKCHDEENSPLFDLETYWEKVKHE